MRKNLTEADIDRIYDGIKRLVLNKYSSGSYTDSINHIIDCAVWMYHFNTRYADIELDNTIKNISEKALNQHNISQPDNNRIVLIDNFGLDNRGLTQQYIRSLVKLDKDILYILHNEQPNGNSEIIRELKEYDKATIHILTTNPNNIIDSASRIAQKITEFSPNDILLHIAPWDVTSLLAISSIKGATKYNINLTDHAFWLGASFFDYNIEFRGYGRVLSLEKRGFKEEQLISLPFYPIVSKYTHFQGFPKLPENSIKIFCGGAEYKMLGKNDIFFKMMDDILEISEDVQILVAGISCGTTFENKVKNLKHKDRIHLIGDRKDINDVFANSDIFLSSYPFVGGLMTQFAATNKVPVLAYAEPEEVGTVDAFVNHFGEALSTKRSMHEFLDYARDLICNAEFRKSEGEKCFNVSMNKSCFYKYLNKALTSQDTEIQFPEEIPDYQSMISYYLDVENLTHQMFEELVYRLKLKTFLLAPKHAPFIIKIMTKRVLHKVFKVKMSK